MKFKFDRTVTHEFDFTISECDMITRQYLRFLIGKNTYLRTENDKIVVKEDDPYWRHGSVSENYVRDATEMDITIFKLLDLMQ